jgi:hypothetical protein
VRSLNCVPAPQHSNAAGVISANVAVRSLNRARHSRFSACRALNKIGCSPIVSRTPRRAGSRPPLLGTCVRALPMAPCSADERRAPGAVGVSRPWKTSAIAPALAFHGGLTPAALGHVRSIAKIAFCRQTFAPQHRSGGRQPPVDAFHIRTRSAEVRSIAFADAVYKPTAGSRPPLLGTCVRPSQKSLFAGRHSHGNTGAGGVSPP